MSKEDIRILKISVTSGDSILMDSIRDINKIYTGYKKNILKFVNELNEYELCFR